MDDNIYDINSCFSNNHCDFENNVNGVDTLCGTIASLNRIYADPILKQQVLNTSTFRYPEDKLNTILTSTQKLLRTNKPTQQHFIQYIETLADAITKYLKTRCFSYKIPPNKDNDCIHYFNANDKVGFLEGFGVSYKNDKYYPYDTFLYDFLIRTKTLKPDSNNLIRYNTKKCKELFKNNPTQISVYALKQNINELVKEYEEKKQIVTTIQVLYNHDSGGHYVTFVRNKHGDMDFIRADTKHDDNELVEIKKMNITKYPVSKLTTIYNTYRPMSSTTPSPTAKKQNHQIPACTLYSPRIQKSY